MRCLKPECPVSSVLGRAAFCFPLRCFGWIGSAAFTFDPHLFFLLEDRGGKELEPRVDWESEEEAEGEVPLGDFELDASMCALIVNGLGPEGCSSADSTKSQPSSRLEEGATFLGDKTADCFASVVEFGGDSICTNESAGSKGCVTITNGGERSASGRDVGEKDLLGEDAMVAPSTGPKVELGQISDGKIE